MELLIASNLTHIKSGFRKCSTHQECLRSLLYLNNETGNIWSFLLPTFYYFYLLHECYHCPHQDVFTLLQVLNLFAGLCCFGSSCWYHTFRCISPRLFTRYFRLDCCGVATQTMGSAIATMYVGFFCFASLRDRYVTIASFLLLICLSLATGIWPRRVQYFLCKLTYTNCWMEMSLRAIILCIVISMVPFGHWVTDICTEHEYNAFFSTDMLHVRILHRRLRILQNSNSGVLRVRAISKRHQFTRDMALIRSHRDALDPLDAA